MEVDVSRSRKKLGRVAYAVVASLLAVVPASTAGADEATGAFHESTLTTLSGASRVVLQRTARASEQTQTEGQKGAQSFLTSKKGALTIALIGAGFGYALYSKINDRVMSPVR
jgi:hypothetical protein